ncbi:hypothetical protein [Clostridium transplantifaecale]|uniref:hypothetical protein n=1 Tax=Clostridium transplantifaecale TaxID=2479838 RepID=UPI000F6308EF|nr:hypothetical protein [Clostridium transplantifaecale]
MIEKFKKMLFSENGMRIVNVLFFLSLCLRSRIVVICTFSIWTAFLLYSRKKTESGMMKIFYLLLIILALVVVAANIYSLIH